MVDDSVQLPTDHLLRARKAKHTKEGRVAEGGSAVLVDAIETLRRGIEQQPKIILAFALGGVSAFQCRRAFHHLPLQFERVALLLQGITDRSLENNRVEFCFD